MIPPEPYCRAPPEEMGVSTTDDPVPGSTKTQLPSPPFVPRESQTWAPKAMVWPVVFSVKPK